MAPAEVCVLGWQPFHVKTCALLGSMLQEPILTAFQSALSRCMYIFMQADRLTLYTVVGAMLECRDDHVAQDSSYQSSQIHVCKYSSCWSQLRRWDKHSARSTVHNSDLQLPQLNNH